MRRRYDHREPFFIRSALYCPGWGGHITKHSEQLVYICFGVFASIRPPPHNVPLPFSTHHTWSFPPFVLSRRYDLAKGFKALGGREVAWWIGSGEREELASTGGIRGHTGPWFFGFSSYRTRRVYGGFAGSLNTCCNCTAQAEQQAQPSWLWDKLYLFATWFCGGQGPQAVVGEDACCLGGGAFFASSIQYRSSLSAQVSHGIAS